SRKAIGSIIRGSMAYDGLIMSDDLSMKALKGPFESRAAAALEAGCDVILHCNGDMAEMKAIAAAAPELSGESLRRARAALARIAHEPEPLEAVEARARVAAALAVTG